MKQLTVPFLTGLAKILSGATVRWIDCEPDDTCQRIYFANHTSHLDALVLWGDVQTIRQRLEAFSAAGVDRVVVIPHNYAKADSGAAVPDLETLSALA